MRKFLCLFFVMVLCISFVGCSKESQTDYTEEETNTEIQEPRETQNIAESEFNVINGTVEGFKDEYSVLICDGKYGVIDKNGEFIIPCEYDNIRALGKNLFQVMNNRREVSLWNGNKQIVTFGKYDSFGNDGSYYPDFAENRVRVRKGQLFGFVDLQGNEVVPTIYVAAEIYSEGYCAVKEKDGNWGYINSNGSMVIPFEYFGAKNFGDGIAPVKNSEGKWGFIGRNGETVIPFDYTNADAFSEGIGRVATMTEWGELWGYISTNGVMLTNFEYYYLNEFSNGFGVAAKHTGEGYIKKDGTPLTEFCYDSAAPFSEGGVARVKRDGFNDDIIDTTGKSILPSGYKLVSVGFSDYGLHAVEKANGEIGYIDDNGYVVIEAVYDKGSDRFVNGVAHVYKDGQEYFIDEKENILFYIEK